MLDRERADHRFATLLRWVTGTRPERLIVLCFDAPADAAGAGATALRLAGCLADLPAHRLVDLALASGGSVVAAHDACPAAAALPHLEPLPALTGVRVTVRAQTPEPGQPAVVVDEAQPPVGRRFLVRRPTEPPVIEHAADSDDQARLVLDVNSDYAFFTHTASLPGDANEDGSVDLDDFVTLKQRFGTAPAAWFDGDFNADGAVDLDDFAILKQNFGATAAP